MSTIRVNNLQNTTTTDGGISIDNSGHVTVDGQAMPSAGPLSNRNLIINGAMQVAQRGTSGSFVHDGTRIGYVTDRWKLLLNSAWDEYEFTATQSTDTPVGFANSLLITTGTAETTVDSNEFFSVDYHIEAQDLQGLEYGTSDAKETTLSFWVRSSQTGTYVVSVYKADNTSRGITRTYSISSANTWEYKTISIPGDTGGGGINNDNGSGLQISWIIAAGSNYTSTDSSSWINYTSSGYAYGQGTNAVTTTASATWQITGVQLEVGSVATPFEHRSYGDELQMCQRYYWNLLLDKAETNMYIGNGTQYSSTTCIMVLHPPVTMRTVPSLDVSNSSGHFSKLANGSTTNFSTFAISSIISAASLTAIATVSGTAGHSAILRVSNDAAKFAFSAEL